MFKHVVIVDLDNTIIDTAVRKCAILKDQFTASGAPITLERVRTDFDMKQWLKSQTDRADLYSQLNSSQGIQKYPAPLVSGADEAISAITAAGVSIILLSSRAESLRYATLEELKTLGLKIDSDHLYLRAGPSGAPEPTDQELTAFKQLQLQRLKQEHCVLGFVGDRPSDVEAARLSCVVPILLTSTIRDEELTDLKRRAPQSQACETWRDVRHVVLQIMNSLEDYDRLRQSSIDQYASWLRDIDQKCRITVTIAAVLVGIAGKLLLGEPNPWLRVPLIFSLLASLLAFIYGIRAYTSRHTSGSRAGSAIKTAWKQWVAYLIGRPQSWAHGRDDETAELQRFRAKPTSVQAMAHIPFFAKRYGTVNSDAMLNFRLLELRASNYSKLYGERIASHLLIWSVIFMMTWLIGAAIGHQNRANRRSATLQVSAHLRPSAVTLRKYLRAVAPEMSPQS